MLRPAAFAVALVGLLSGPSLALTPQQKVATDLLRAVGATAAPCVQIVPQAEYRTLKAEDQAGRVVCGRYAGSVRAARERCTAKFPAQVVTPWATQRNRMTGVFQQAGYEYRVTLTCTDRRMVVQIVKLT